jgi:CRISPR/Cas system Type II protein with McrA/HNH and RuvC-like nuclease domain
LLKPVIDDLKAQLKVKKAEKKKIQADIDLIVFNIDHIKICEECGSVFIAKSTSVKCCSDKCQRKKHNRSKDKRLSKNGEPDKSITLTKLYMRDLGVCQICGKVIDFDVDTNDDSYPSIDHIKPISKGGLHEWDNVQLACRKCNTAKGSKMDYTPPRC